MAEAVGTTPKTTKRTTGKQAKSDSGTATGGAARKNNKEEAKSRFNAALEEAKAGAAALSAEAKDRASTYRTRAKTKGDDYAGQAKTKASDLAKDGKARASDALSSLGQIVADNAHTLDEKLGSRYGDYARSASRSLQESAAKLDNKSVEELGEDAREFVRRSPGTAVGLAALAGFLVARMFRSK